MWASIELLIYYWSSFSSHQPQITPNSDLLKIQRYSPALQIITFPSEWRTAAALFDGRTWSLDSFLVNGPYLQDTPFQWEDKCGELFLTFSLAPYFIFSDKSSFRRQRAFNKRGRPARRPRTFARPWYFQFPLISLRLAGCTKRTSCHH